MHACSKTLTAQHRAESAIAPYWLFPMFKRLRYLTLSLLVCLVCWFGSPGAAGAEPDLPWLKALDWPGIQLAEVTADSPATAIVRLDGHSLFDVAATGRITAEARAMAISERLGDYAETQKQGDSPTSDALPVTWKYDPETNQPVIYLGDQLLMTVTSTDLGIAHGVSSQGRAAELVRQLQSALDRYHQERQPAFLQRQLARGTGLLLFLAGLSYGLKRLRGLLQRRLMPAEGAEQSTMTALQNKIQSRERKSYRAVTRWGYRLGQVIIWVGGLFMLLELFPYVRSWQQPLSILVKLPLRIVSVVILGCLTIQIGGLLVNRFFLVLHDESLHGSVRSQRFSLRFSTFSQVSRGVLSFMVITICTLWILSIIGVDLGPLLAGAGIIGLALSLASQSLLKDIINGFMILMEDHYGLGDVIIVENVAGFVEVMNLRITQLRNEEGRLITIPNGQIGIVQNLSKEWSRVDLLLPVSLDANIDEALAVIDQVATAMHQDPKWQPLILDKHELLGVDILDHVGATVRLWIKTLPLKQWDVAREYRRRLKIAFDQADIKIGMPQQSISVRGNKPQALAIAGNTTNGHRDNR